MRNLFILFFLTLLPWTLMAQDSVCFRALIPDSTIRSGTLYDGTTYYIKHNCNPKERGQFSRRCVKVEQADRYAIIVVGDVDVDSMEVEIRRRYDSHKTVERLYQRTNPNRLLRTDWAIKYDYPIATSQQRRTTEVIYNEMMLTMIGDMLNVRLLRLREQMDDCPFVSSAFVFSTELTGLERESLCLRIISKPKRAQEARAVSREEIEKVIVRPFTDFEVDYARQQFMLAHQRIQDDLEELTNVAYVWRIANAFQQGNVIVALEDEWRVQQELERWITPESCNAMIREILRQ